mmetsp:Transcript_11104/g.23844  ORF Transcript_11104/g.23844 Transcript_11104/m.23844 type:complete len:237 (+) Transcript_11104:215-925(+)
MLYESMEGKEEKRATRKGMEDVVGEQKKSCVDEGVVDVERDCSNLSTDVCVGAQEKTANAVFREMWNDLSEEDVALLEGELSDCPPIFSPLRSTSSPREKQTDTEGPKSPHGSRASSEGSSMHKDESLSRDRKEDHSIHCPRRRSRRMFRALSGRPGHLEDFYDPQKCVECRFGDMRRTWTFLDLSGDHQDGACRRSAEFELGFESLESSISVVRRTQSCKTPEKTSIVSPNVDTH